MAKVLNIDALAPQVQRTVTIGGETHNVLEMTVGNFIQTVSEAERLKDNENSVDQVNASIDQILRYVPTLSRDKLAALTFEQLATISAFIRGDADDKAEEGDDAEKK